MPAVATSQPCAVCGGVYPIQHSHHTTPRCRGGEDSPQVILCANHHNVLHAHALYIVSCMRNPKRKRSNKTFWENTECEHNAQPLLQLLVNAFLTPIDKDVDLPHLVSTELKTEEFHQFKVLAKDLGCSQSDAVRYCILQVLKNKGFSSEKVQPALWFLPKSRP